MFAFKVVVASIKNDVLYATFDECIVELTVGVTMVGDVGDEVFIETPQGNI